MNKDQSLWQALADEIGDIALPDPADFEDGTSRNMAEQVLADIELLRQRVSKFAVQDVNILADFEPAVDGEPDLVRDASEVRGMTEDGNPAIVVGYPQYGSLDDDTIDSPLSLMDRAERNDTLDPGDPVETEIEKAEADVEAIGMVELEKAAQVDKCPSCIHPAHGDECVRFISQDPCSCRFDSLSAVDHGTPGVDFDPKKEPNKLPPDHPDYIPF